MQVVPTTEAPIVRVEIKSKLGLDGPKPTAPHRRAKHAPAVGEVPAAASRARRRRNH